MIEAVLQGLFEKREDDVVEGKGIVVVGIEDEPIFIEVLVSTRVFSGVIATYIRPTKDH